MTAWVVNTKVSAQSRSQVVTYSPCLAHCSLCCDLRTLSQGFPQAYIYSGVYSLQERSQVPRLHALHLIVLMIVATLLPKYYCIALRNLALIPSKRRRLLVYSNMYI
jgi:hypothetical protein